MWVYVSVNTCTDTWCLFFKSHTRSYRELYVPTLQLATKFSFSASTEDFSNVLLLFVQFGMQNGTSPPPQLLSVCLPYWDTMLLLYLAVQLLFLLPWHLVTSLKAFLALCYLGQSHPISMYIAGVCAASEPHGQNPACGSSLRQEEQGVELWSFLLWQPQRPLLMSEPGSCPSSAKLHWSFRPWRLKRLPEL